ncbi:unnamed protein product [Rhizopus stolonifer]
MLFHSYVFSKEVDITEADIVVKVWSPILERLFRKMGLRTKWYVRIQPFVPRCTYYNKLLKCESAADTGDVSDSLGFKVDLRVMKDTLLRRKKEADKENCKISRIGLGLVKITSDKKVADCVENSSGQVSRRISRKSQRNSVSTLQLIGNRAILCSLGLAASGLYVGVKEGCATIPKISTTLSSLK